jgi:hypothetical protein
MLFLSARELEFLLSYPWTLLIEPPCKKISGLSLINLILNWLILGLLTLSILLMNDLMVEYDLLVMLVMIGLDGGLLKGLMKLLYWLF